MRSLRPVLFMLIIAGLLSGMSGCGYHAAGSAVHLPSSMHSLAVPVFANATQSYHTELDFTQAVIREFSSRTPYSIVNADRAEAADATLNGTIIKFDILPLTYNSRTGQSSSFLITVLTRVSVVDRANRVVYKNDSYMFRQQYQTTQDLTSFIQEDPAAVRRLSRDFARSLVSDILDSF